MHKLRIKSVQRMTMKNYWVMPSVDWLELAEFEQEDYTVASQELACVVTLARYK